MNDKNKQIILADIKKPSPKKCPKSETGEHCYHESCMDGIEKNNCQHSTDGRNSKCTFFNTILHSLILNDF